jgi:hypothetical protein
MGAALLVFALFFAACDNGSTPPAPSLDSISVIAQPAKVSYTPGEGFSSTGLRVNAVYSDSSIKEIAAADRTLAWNGAFLEEGSTAITGSVGNKIVTITYGGKTANFTISVNYFVYTISGTITTSDGASALGAAAQLKQGGLPVGLAVSTGANGAYAITGVSPGTYTIDVSLAGYIPGTITAFTVSGANITGKDLVLQKTSGDDATPPAEVSGLTGIPGDGTVTLTWTDPADDDLDHIEITWTDGSVTAEKSTTGDRTNSKAIDGLINGTAYALTVKAVDTSGNKSQGETASATPGDTTPPAGVTGLTAVAGIRAVTLTWTDPADDDLDHIEITWTGGSVTTTKSMAADRYNSKAVTGLTSGTAYDFIIKAMDASSNESQEETVSATPIDIEAGTAITIASTEDWTNARIQINTDGNGTSSNPKVYTLDIQGIVSVLGVGSSENTISGSYKIVHLTGSGTLSLSSEGSIFCLGNSNQTLIIDGPILTTSRTNNSAPLVYAGDGTMELWNGTISGNTSSSSNGGGVYVGNGTFIMSGGTISNNFSSSYGADSANGTGVYVADNGTFTMSGGTISNNISYSNGAGVYVASNGTFTMSGGTISDNTAFGYGGGGVHVQGRTFTMSKGTISGNTSAYGGGGVYVNTSGTFTKTGGTIYGDTDHIFGNGNATDNTATVTTNLGTNGHAVMYYSLNNYYYRNETLTDDASGNISTTDTLPVVGGILNNWTKR